MNPVVRIDKCDPLTLRSIKASIAGGRSLRIFLMDHPDPHIFRSILITDNSASVRAAVIHKNQFKVRKAL